MSKEKTVTLKISLGLYSQLIDYQHRLWSEQVRYDNLVDITSCGNGDDIFDVGKSQGNAGLANLILTNADITLLGVEP